MEVPVESFLHSVGWIMTKKVQFKLLTRFRLMLTLISTALRPLTNP